MTESPLFDRRSRRTRVVLGLLATFVLWGSLPGCFEETVEPACTGLPDGGCPSAFGRACDDRACAAAFACTREGWKLVEVCPPRDGGGGDASLPIEAGVVDAGGHDVDVSDVLGANGGPGCIELGSPDCSLATAAACPRGCCGCEELFVCRAGGWELWGACDELGGLLPAR